MYTPTPATSTRRKATTPTGTTQAGMPPSLAGGTTGTRGIGVAVGPGVGLGVERRVADDRMTGHALTLNGSIVHAAFFSRAAREAQPPPNGRRPTRQGDDGAR